MAEKETTEKIIADLDEMHYDMKEIANRAMENLGGNREYQYLLERCATYRRKVDRIEARQEKKGGRA